MNIMVNKQTVIEAVLEASTNPLFSNKHIDIVREYCLEHGKPKLQIELFLKYIAIIHLFRECFDIAADYYIRKFNLILVYDKDNKLINLIDNVRTKRQTDCRSKKAVQEFSSCNEED